jgi:hypothetical protein
MLISFLTFVLTLRRADERRLTSAEMHFKRRTVGYTLLDRKKPEDSLQELRIYPIMDFVQEYRKSWNQHVIRMNNNRLPKKKKNVQVCSLWPKKCGKTSTKMD